MVHMLHGSLLLSNCDPLEVDIVSFVHVSRKNAAGLVYHTAPLQMAVEHENDRYYGNLRFKLITVATGPLVEFQDYVDDAPEITSQWYYRQKRPSNQTLTVIISPCK